MVRTLRRLTAYGKAHGVRLQLDGWHGHVARLKHAHAMQYDRTSALIQPNSVIEEINRHTDGRAIISTGVGQHQMWAAQYFDFREPRHWLTSGSMGTMGFGLPAAIGAQFARPDALVIDIDGDASIRMNIGELETVTTCDLPIKVVVLNNVGDGMVRQWQKLFFNGRFAASDKTLHRKDFIKAAQADGFDWAKRLEHKEELARTIADFLAFDGPAFLEVMIDPDAGVYPMIGPGATYAQMITGDFIASREPPETSGDGRHRHVLNAVSLRSASLSQTGFNHGAHHETHLVHPDAERIRRAGARGGHVRRPPLQYRFAQRGAHR